MVRHGTTKSRSEVFAAPPHGLKVNDPDQGPFVDHLGIVTGRDMPPGLIAATRRRGREAMREALGAEPDPGEACAFDAYLGSLVHDVSLAHHLLRSLGIAAPLPIADAAYFDSGRGVSLAWTLPGDGCAHLEHLNLSAVADYRERVTAYCRDPDPRAHLPVTVFAPPSDPPRRAPLGRDRYGPRDDRLSRLIRGAFRNELRAFHAAITTGVPVRATVEAARDDLAALLDGFRFAASQRRIA